MESFALFLVGCWPCCYEVERFSGAVGGRGFRFRYAVSEGCQPGTRDAVQRRPGGVRLMNNMAGQRFVPPDERNIKRI
jgi:hypothetical protein